jgi:hypothetical protein
MTRRTALLLSLTSFASAYAKEFWNDKKPEQWTPDEVDLLLNKSPWARDAVVSYYGGQNGPLSSTLPNQRTHRGASSGSSPSAPAPADWKAIVRWQSALPVQQALQLEATADLEKFYILNMIGDVPSVGADPDGLAQLKLYTKLEHKGDAINLSRVSVAPANNITRAGTLFYFSRDLALRPEDKVATFSTKLGPIDLKCKFTLKEMMYRGKLEL